MTREFVGSKSNWRAGDRRKDGQIFFRRKKERQKWYDYWCSSEQEFVAEQEKKKSADARYYAANQEQGKQRAKQYYQNNRGKVLEYLEGYRLENRARILDKKKQHYANNKEKYKRWAREWHQRNAKSVQQKSKKYRENNREYLSQKKKEWQRTNKDRIAKTKLVWEKEKRATDPLFAMRRRCACRMRNFIRARGFTKRSRTAQMLGCDWETLKTHIEAQFVDGMSWDNRSEWHIDHIIPLASASTEEEVLKLCHYTNLQPLWAADNLSKGARLDYELDSSPTSQ